MPQHIIPLPPPFHSVTLITERIDTVNGDRQPEAIHRLYFADRISATRNKVLMSVWEKDGDFSVPAAKGSS